MMRKVFFAAVVLCLVCGVQAMAAESEAPLTVELAEDHVRITTGFTGDSLTLFGYKGGRGDVAVILEGPKRDSKVRRKEQIFGAWINRSWLNFEQIPSYYDYALSVDDENGLLSDEDLKGRDVGVGSLRFAPHKDRYDADTVKDFQNALLRNKQDQQLFPLKPQRIEFLSPHLFRVDFQLPANVPSGEYTVRALLIRNHKVVYEDALPLRVGLEGFSSDIYKFARDHSFLYGVLCVFLALMAGWLSNAIVRRN